MQLLSFSAEIFIIGVNPYVLLPEKVLSEIFIQAGKEKGPIPVKGTLNENMFIQTLVKYKGEWRLYLNGIMRKAAGVDVRDIVRVEIAYDPVLRSEKMPEKFVSALLDDKQAKEIYEGLAPYRKKEILRYLNSMKTEASLEKNIAKVILHLLGKKTDTLHALMRRAKDASTHGVRV